MTNNRIDYEKIQLARRTMSLSDRLKMTVGDFVEDIRTPEDRVYHSPIVFWFDRLKDINDAVEVFSELTLPPVLKTVYSSLGKFAISTFSPIHIPSCYTIMEYSQEKRGYIFKR